MEVDDESAEQQEYTVDELFGDRSSRTTRIFGLTSI